MGISFFERMRGELVDESGDVRPIDFEIKAEADPLGRLLTTGETRITGVVHAPPWATRAPMAGVLTITPFVRKTLEYGFQFESDTGAPMSFAGKKAVRWRRPVESMTVLRGQLTLGGQVVARGELRFDLNDLTAFLASFWPGASIQRIQLTTGSEGVPLAGLLSERELNLLEAFAAAIIVPAGCVPEADATTVQATVEQLRVMPPEAVAAWRGLLRGLDVLALTRSGRSFARLPLERRRVLVESLAVAREGQLASGRRRLLDLLCLPVRSAHFSRPDFLRVVGFPDLENRVHEPPPRYLEQVIEPEGLGAMERIEADVVVVGTGAGGAALAAVLAERGVGVALVEEGRYVQRNAFSGSPTARMRRFYRHHGMTFTVGQPPISIPLGRLVGGTTAINSGTCFRAPDHVLHSWRAGLGFPEDFGPTRMAGYYAQVEEELQVAPGDRRLILVLRTGRPVGGGSEDPVPGYGVLGREPAQLADRRGRIGDAQEAQGALFGYHETRVPPNRGDAIRKGRNETSRS